MDDPNANVDATEETASSRSPMSFDSRYLSKVGFIVKKVVHTWPLDEEVAERPAEEAYSEEAPKSLEHLDFVPQPMVSWYRPSELVRTGINAVVSAVFGSYADKREVMSVLTKEEWYDYSEQLRRDGELWFDYVADLGDGWDATYTIARLLAEKELTFTHKGETHPTYRGKLLVMGGDEVYPTATREEYENRLIQPYRCAMPFVQFMDQTPHLYLIPGNHDWYDGLNSFFKTFCHHNWVGAWRTQQRRSYFALKLDEKLWLWGIDIQLSSNIDQPQLNYFNHLAIEQMEEGSKIILCTAEPSWVYVNAKTKEAKKKVEKATNPKKKRKYENTLKKKQEEIYHNLGHLENKVIKPNGHEVIVGLAGDWHNYTRYQSKNGHQRFVSGGGGAYLYPTHNMPLDLKLPKEFGGAEYHREAIFPSEPESKKLANRSLFFSFFRLNWYFTGFLGAFYLLLAWIIQSVSKVAMGPDHTLLDTFNTAGWWDGLKAFFEIIAHSPESVVYLLILVAGLMAFSNYESGPKKIVHGGLHGLAHVLLFLGLLYVIAQVNLGLLGLDVSGFSQVALFFFEMLLFGGFLGGVVFGVYLWFSNRFLKIHDNEVLLCQSHPDYKNFLRFHLAKDRRTLTIYPIGVKRVIRKRSWKLDKTERNLAAWELQTEAKDGASWFEPKNGKIQDLAELIEKPIEVSL